MFKFAKAGLIAGAAWFAASAGMAGAAQQEIGNDMGRCAAGAAGSAVLVDVSGFDKAVGIIRVQSYPATKSAWLEKGQWINRIEMPARPNGGQMLFCVPVPGPGRYAIAVRHDRNNNGKTDISEDGGGFSNNPKASIFNLGKPSVDKAAFAAGSGVTRISIKLQYL